MVTSGSSPASFLTAHSAQSFPARASATARSRRTPPGVRRAIVSGARPVSSRTAAALAAAAAQEPVVYPRRSRFPSFITYFSISLSSPAAG